MYFTIDPKILKVVLNLHGALYIDFFSIKEGLKHKAESMGET